MYNSHRPQKHPFEIVENGKYGGAIVKCPVCGITRWDSTMRIHIAKQAREEHFKGGGPHLDYYNENTEEEIITRRKWKV